MYRISLIAGVLLAAAAVPAAAQREYQSNIDTTFAFDRRGTVSLTLQSGDIVVTSWNRDQIRVRARSGRSLIRMDASPTRVSLDLMQRRGGSTRFEVTVPVGVRITARAGSGDVSISGTKGAVEAHSQSGDISVEDAAERIQLSTLSGDVVGRALAGNVEVRAVSGDVSLSDVRSDDVEATSVSGDIDLRGVAARYVRAKSTSGEVTFDGNIDNTGRYELGSHSGSVFLTIPQTTGALLTVSTYSGGIESDFPITLQPGEHGIGMSKRLTFEIGKGDARISAESFSGDITIRSKRR